MGKAIDIGVIIVLGMICAFAVEEVFTNEHNKRVEAYDVFVVCAIILGVVMIFGGIGYF